MQKGIAAAAVLVALVCGSGAAQIVDRGARERALPPYRTGWDYMHAEAWPEAEKSFSQAVDVDSQFELAYYGLGQALMAQKRFIEATAAYVKCRDLYRAQAGRRFTSAQEAQRYREERLTELDDLARQLQSGPQSLRSQERLRQIQEQRKVIQESFQRGGNISIENTVPSFVSLALGSAYFRSSRFEDAEREYKVAINSDAKIGEAHNNLAVVYLMTGRPDDAEREVKAAERVGFKVQPALKDDIKKAKQKGTNE